MAYLLSYSLAFAALAAACWGPGAWLARALRAGRGLGGLEPLARIGLGLAAWTGVLFFSAATGLLWPGVLRALLGIALALAAAAALRRVQTEAWRRRVDPAQLTGTALLTVFLTPFFLLAVTPAVSWDAGVYHLQLPKLFLAYGGFRPVPFSVYANWPLGTELLFALAMAAKDYVLAKLVHFGFGLLVLWAVFAGCRAGHRRASGWLAMALFLANGVVGFELRVANVDLAHAFYFLAAVLFMSRALDEPGRTGGALWLSGVCAGLMAGVKLNGIVGAAIVGALYLPRLAFAWRSADRWPALRPFFVQFAAPVAAFWLPWLFKTWWTTGNPFYPFFHRVFGGPDWSETLTALLAEWQSSIGMGRTPIDYLLLPARVILAGGDGYDRFDGELGSFWIVVLPVALWGAWRSLLARRCLAAAGLYFVSWSLTSQQMRLLVPALPLLAIASAVALVELMDCVASTRRRRAGLALAFAVAAGLVTTTHARVIAAGSRTLGVYLRPEGDLKGSAVHPVYRFVNRELPPEARLLLLNTNQGFFCDREVLADSFFEASQIAAWLAPAEDVPDLRRRLAERGVTHVLLEHRDWGIAYPEALKRLLGDPEEVEILYRSRDGRYSLFALRSSRSFSP